MKNLTKTQFVESSIKGAYAAFYSGLILLTLSLVVIVYNYDQVATIPLVLSTVIYARFVYTSTMPRHFKVADEAVSIDVKLEKLSNYMAKRAKLEIPIIAVWMFTFIPFIIINAVFIGILFGLVILFGTGAFMAFDKKISSLKNTTSHV